MNLKHFLLVLLVSISLWAQPKEITSVQFSSVVSEYALSDKDQYRLYTPSRIIVINRLSLGRSTNGDYGNYINSSQRATIPPIVLRQNKIQLSGPHIIILEPYLVPSNIRKISANVLFNQIDNTQPFIKIDLFDDYKLLSQQSQTSTGTSYSGFRLFTDVKTLPGRYSLSGLTKDQYFTQKSSSNLYGSALLDTWTQYLRDEKFDIYGRPFFVQTPNGDIYPAVIKVYGIESLMYAMYGVWTDEGKAAQFGYHKGDRVYMSAKQMLPQSNDNTCSAASELQISQAQRYGRKIFSYDAIIADPRNIYPQLSWAPEPIYSDMTEKTYDQTGTAFHNGIEVPNAPDNDNNMNGMGIQQCSDMDWYWAFFCECADKIVNVTETKFDPTQFVDYKDYLYTEQMKQQYDPTIYGDDQSVAPYKVDPDHQPVEPFLFNKDCVLLNAKVPEVYDPFAPDVTFSLTQRYWDWDWIETGYKSRNYDIKDKMQTCISELRNVYTYFTTMPKRETDWSYKDGKKKWPYDGDVEISIDNPEYADSAWYLANPFANYAPFEDFNNFAALDNWTADGQGPFRLITRENDTRDDDKTNSPDYQRYTSPWIGGDYPAEQAWEKKDWFVQWKYYMLIRDKWGRKLTTGTLTFTSCLWKSEDEGVMPANFEFSGSKRNIYVKVGGSILLPSQVAYYDKKSKEYRTDQTDIHDRSPDDFDKGEAMREIARKIIVAETFDYTMKTLHYIGTHQNNQAGAAAAILYEASKRIENRIAQSISYKLAKGTYDGYVLWRRTMDALKNLRDTYVKIGDAWNGLLYTAHAISDYYANLDLSKIRLTNCTDLFPRSAFIELDYRLYSMQKSFANFNAAVHTLALETDSITHGNYGPLNPAIRVVYAGLQSSVRQSGENTSVLLDNTNAEVNKLKSKTSSTSSDQQYLSNITKSSYNIITNQRIKVMNNGAKNLALALYMTESESKQWLTYGRYMKRIAKEAPGNFEDAAISGKSESWAKLAACLYQPRIFDEPTSQYLEQLSEK